MPSHKELRTRLIADRDNLQALLFSDDLTDEALREASERLLPRIADGLHLAIGALYEPEEAIA